MISPRTPRLALFALAAALLLLAALLFSAADPSSRGTTPLREALAADARPMLPQPAVQAEPSALRSAAQRFLAAFLRYEVGASTAPVRRALRAAASPPFLAELLAAPPRQLTAHHPGARIARMRITLLSRAPGRAIVSGSAHRGARLEQFSFLFESDRGVWRCVGPGE